MLLWLYGRLFWKTVSFEGPHSFYTICPARPVKSNDFYVRKAQGQVSLHAQGSASDLFEPQLHLIWANLFTLRFKCCSECGSCKQRHEKHHRWRERSHGESCVHSPPTCTRSVWSKPHAFEVCMPLCGAKYGCVKNLACMWCHHLHTSATNTHAKCTKLHSAVTPTQIGN